MRIVLTGRTGQLGRALKAPLEKLGSLTSLDREGMDLANPEALRPRLSELKPNLIVNAAAYTNVDGAESDPETALAINGKAPDVLAGWAAENEASIVHFSTDYVYDGGGDQPRAESDPCNPANAYGQSKLVGDQAVLSSGAPHAVLRTSWLYSETGKNFFRTMLRLGAERQELRIVDDQIGAPTSTNLLAAIVNRILQQADGDISGFLRKNGGLYHAAAAGETSWYGFATEIFAMARRRNFKLAVQDVAPIPSTEYPLPATRPTNSRLALTKLENTFGISPPLWQTDLEGVFDRLETAENE